MDKTYAMFRKSLNWFDCLLLTVLLSNVVAPPITSYQATKFLEKYGYLREDRDSSLISMRSTNNAVLDYQEFMGLEETGELDDATLAMMSKPRCGVKDKLNDDDDLIRRKRYATEGIRWSKGIYLYYRITKYPERITDRRLVDREFKRAFKVWSMQTQFVFHETTQRPDIDIRFEKEYHGDRSPFDGPGFTLAHASTPRKNAFIHFDDEEEWTIDEYSGTNLFQVAAHEIGHALGLLHSEHRNTLMFPNYNETTGPIAILGADDVCGIRQLYGDQGLPIPSNEISALPMSIDAATMTEDGKAYMFKGRRYWEFIKNEDFRRGPAIAVVRPGSYGNISDDWVGFSPNPSCYPTRNIDANTFYEQLDAALTWPNGQTFLFMRDKYWSFRNKVMDPGNPKLISEGFEGIPMNIDAAVEWNNQTYFFKGSNFWVYDRQKTPPVGSEYPQPISTLNGVPDDIDAAMQFADHSTYLFKGREFYRINKDTFTVSNWGSMMGSWFG